MYINKCKNNKLIKYMLILINFIKSFSVFNELSVISKLFVYVPLRDLIS